MNFKRISYIIGGVLAVALIGLIAFLGLQPHDKTANLNIQSAVPTDINVTLDGTKVKSTTKVALTPGKHTVSAKRNGFEDQTQTVDVKAGETKTIRLLMKPNGPEGESWARDHPDQFREFEALAGNQFDQNSAAIRSKYPLLTLLPTLHPTWRIDYGKSVAHPDDATAIAIIITYGGGEIDKQNALDWIKSQGFNPNDYEIIYKTPPAPGG